jgi:predicted ATPase/DNA-binding SARP family transcriptional activator
MALLTIDLLGPPRVSLAGRPLDLRVRKELALLAYLAVEQGHPHSRETLVALLWPDAPEEAARNNLRVVLAGLRRLLGETSDALLRADRQSARLLPAGSTLDTTTFRGLLAAVASHTHLAAEACDACVARLAEAVAIYRGDFLAGFSLPDSTPFEEWAVVQREQLHQLQMAALETLAVAHELRDDHATQVAYGRRLLALEPWREAAHDLVIRGLWASGERGAALEQFEACRRILADELGLQPSPELAALAAQLRSAETPRAAAPPATPRAARPEPPPLPVVSTPLVGRAQALAAIESLLQRPGVRLLTMVGPGGMGKTRLAVEVGAGAQRGRLDSVADGVFFVPLAPISTPAALVGTIATALGMALQGGDPRAALFQMLRQKRLLLILDNFEHLLAEGTDAVDLVVDMMGAAPGVQLIVTSRERLKLRDEQLYPVQALHVPAMASLAEAAESEAVRLFVQSVRRVQSGFHLTAANLAAVLRICRLVQGMPLGLELAAANAGGLPLAAIADAIEQSAEFLAVDWRDVPERQRSMRAVFAWSWQLLSAEQRRILRQSAVFRGGFAYAAAQAVLGTKPSLLTGLTDTSLLQWQETAAGEGRYTMHELLRQFAAEELDLAGERALVEERHGRYYLAYLAARGRRLGRGEPERASSEIQAELDNVRLAWQWAVAHGRLAEIEQATYALWQFCHFQGLEYEGQQSFARAVEGVRRHVAQADEGTALPGQRLLAKLLAIHANYLFAHGRDEDMVAQAREAVALGRASGGFEGETFGTFVLGRALQDLEQKHEAGEMWQRTIQLVHLYHARHPESEVLHEAHWMAHNWLRGRALHFGDYAGSRASMVQALQICQALGKRWAELYCLAALAGIDFLLYDFAAAEAGFVTALELARTLSYRRVEMVAQEGLSGVLRLRGDYARARTLLEQAVGMAAELASPYDEALFLAALVRLLCQLGDQGAAAQRHEQLTQLLARVKLAKECQLYGYLATAVRAYDAGATQEALRAAELADQVNQQGGDILFRLVDTALILGHVRAAVGQWQAATAAFQQALEAFQRFGKRALAAEPQAGLAHIALAQGDLAGAQAQVEAILPALAEQPHSGYNDPFFIYVTCYRVLAANGDSRAAALLQQGYDLLQQGAAALGDDSRDRFLRGVPAHRSLVAAYAELQANALRGRRPAPISLVLPPPEPL